MEKLNLEVRAKAGKDLEVTCKVNDYGYSKFLTNNKLGRFIEKITKPVWERAIAKATNVQAHYDHQNYINIAESISLRAEEDGVYADIKFFENARGIYEAVKKGLISQMSFGFRALKDKVIENGDYVERHIEDMELLEVSLLDVEAAYKNTAINVRALEEEDSEDKEVRYSTDYEKVDFKNTQEYREILKIKTKCRERKYKYN